jgi:hypothetical protein
MPRRPPRALKFRTVASGRWLSLPSGVYIKRHSETGALCSRDARYLVRPCSEEFVLRQQVISFATHEDICGLKLSLTIIRKEAVSADE